eukprot:scaffold6.g2707.t1
MHARAGLQLHRARPGGGLGGCSALLRLPPFRPPLPILARQQRTQQVAVRQAPRIECVASTQFAPDSERRASHSQASTSGRANGTSAGARWHDSGSSSWQGGAGGVGSGGSWHSGCLRDRICACASAAELSDLLAAFEGELDSCCVAAAWATAARRSLEQGGGWELAGPRAAPRGADLAPQLARLARRHLPAMEPGSLAATAWAAATLGTEAAPELLGDVLRHAEPRLVHFRPSELVALLWALSQYPGVEGRCQLLHRFSDLVSRGMALRPLWGPQEISILIWSCGQMKFSHPALLDEALVVARARVGEFTTLDAARLLHGLAEVRHRPQGLVGPLSAQLKGRLPGCDDPGELTMLLLALGKLQMEPEHSFLRVAAMQASRLVPRSQPDHLARQAWAFARLSLRPTSSAFVLRSARDVAHRPHAYGAELLGAVLWAWARWGYLPPTALLEPVVAQLQREVPTAPAATLSTILWSLSAMHSGAKPQAGARHGAAAARRQPSLAVEALALAATVELLHRVRREGMEASDLSGAVVALGTLGAQALAAAPRRELQLACAACAGELSASELTRLAGALAQLGWREPALLDALGLAAHQLAQLALALAVLGHWPRDLAARLAEAALLQHKQGLEPLDAARLLSAFAAGAGRAGVGAASRAEELLLSELVGAARAADLQRMGPAGAAALLHACVRLRLEPPPQLLASVGPYLARSVRHLSREQRAQAARALAKLGLSDAGVLHALAHGDAGSSVTDWRAAALRAAAPAPTDETHDP